MSGARRVIGSILAASGERLTLAFEKGPPHQAGRVVMLDGQGVTRALMGERPLGFWAARKLVRDTYAAGAEWQYRDASVERRLASSRASKTPWVCPECDQHAWAAPSAELVCGRCYAEDKRLVEMLAVP